MTSPDDLLNPKKAASGAPPGGASLKNKIPNRGTGVKRGNKVPVIIGAVVAGVILGTILYTAHKKSIHNTGGNIETETRRSASDAPAGQFKIPPQNTPMAIPAILGSSPSSSSTSTPASTSSGTFPDNNLQQSPRWEQYYQAKQQIQQQKGEELSQSLHNKSEPEESASLESLYRDRDVAGENVKNASIDANSEQPHPVDTDYLSSYRTGARNALEVKEGSIIPATLIGGINSELPGFVKAEIRQNIYDSATGENILIPQGSYLIGEFGHSVSYGSTRLEAMFTRIIFPDQSSIDIGQMAGADLAGNSGFHDQVNNHWMRIMGSAIMAAAFGSAVQLSQNTTSNNSGFSGYNSQQIIAAQTGQQTGELGMEIARRGLNIAPTIKIRPGYMFNILVRKDMILPPYKDHWGNGAVHHISERGE